MTLARRISCSNNPVEITSIISANVINDWQSGFVSFRPTSNLTFLDGSNDGTPDVEINFNSDGSLVAPTYPIPFSNGDLQISGKVPTEGLLLQIDYNTVRGGSCSLEN